MSSCVPLCPGPVFWGRQNWFSNRLVRSVALNKSIYHAHACFIRRKIQLLRVMILIRTARFCNLFNRPILNPHAKIEYCRCWRIKELYKMRRTCVGRKFFRRHIIPRVRAILFEIFSTCGFQLRCSSIVSHRKLNSLSYFFYFFWIYL